MSGKAGSLELSEPGSVSKSGTVSRGEQTTPEEWNNAKHKAGKSEQGRKKKKKESESTSL